MKFIKTIMNPLFGFMEILNCIFRNDDTLFLIYSDYIDTLEGGPSLRLDKWIFTK